MEFKKIKWEFAQNINGMHKKVAKLPLDYTADLKQYFSGRLAGQVYWRIARENEVVLQGFSESYEKAQEDCQESWESFIKSSVFE